MTGRTHLLPPWKNAVAELFSGKYGYGDVIPHEEIQSAIGLPEPTGRLTGKEWQSWQLKVLAQIDALNDHLLENKNFCLQSVHGRGYRIVEPGEQTSFAMKHGRKAIRKELRKMGRRLVFVDQQALTSEQRKENADALGRLSFMEQQFKQSSRRIFPAKEIPQSTCGTARQGQARSG